MKKRVAAVLAAAALALSPAAKAISGCVLLINGSPATADSMAQIIYDTTYVSLRWASNELDPHGNLTWIDGTAAVQNKDFILTAREGDTYVTINGEKVSVPRGVINSKGRILVPIRTLAEAYQATVYWNSIESRAVVVSELEQSYSADDLYWLSRIISAESRGEPLEGKIAVGNVVLNRVKSNDFPNTIYGVIFDDRWGGQFEPVRNGTIYLPPTEESILAAKLCLSGANVVGESLYFLAPALAQNFWTVKTRPYLTTIGCHDFYL